MKILSRQSEISNIWFWKDMTLKNAHLLFKLQDYKFSFTTWVENFKAKLCNNLC